MTYPVRQLRSASIKLTLGKLKERTLSMMEVAFCYGRVPLGRLAYQWPMHTGIHCTGWCASIVYIVAASVDEAGLAACEGRSQHHHACKPDLIQSLATMSGIAGGHEWSAVEYLC